MPIRDLDTRLGGPVSAALEADLRAWIQKHGVLVWLDPHGHYTDFVDRLAQMREAQALPYGVYAFRGSHLALMMALEGVAAGTERVPVLVHLPGFTEASVQTTPHFALYKAGVRYRKGLETLVTEAAAGMVRPDQIAVFKEQPDITLASADAWLSAFTNDAQGGLGAVLRVMSPTAVLDELLSGGPLAARVDEPADAAVLWERLAAWFGLPASWRATTLPRITLRAEDIAFAAASWALCVDYVDDLQRAPVSPCLASVAALPRPVIDTCRALAAHLRERQPSFYLRTADETEAMLGDEVAAAQAEDLGSVDTFRFEENTVLKAALRALESEAWEVAAQWAALRIEGAQGKASFWLRTTPTRLAAWQLVARAARLGQAITRAGARLGVSTGAGGSLEAAMEAYVERGAAVDQAHRQLEEMRLTSLDPAVPEFETLRARLDAMRQVWRTWADAWACDFSALCRAHGFLPDAAHQQRTLFDEVVRPLTREEGTTAYFVIDALRFEMGEALWRTFRESPATTVHLKGRLAELPTVTAVGMNVLAPVVHNGRLSPALSEDKGSVLGFQTGEFRVYNKDTRKKAMHDRVGGSSCPWLDLDDVLERDATSLKRTIAQASLVVVHSLAIDKAGESGLGPVVFDRVMRNLIAAQRRLREAGVRRFVFTSDHGFLLHDSTAPAAIAHGRKVDPQRRHVFSQQAADHRGETRVALADLGYEGATGYLMFPESTAVFETGRSMAGFVHGGNSLQERVIPVLTVVHRAAAGANTMRYRIQAEAAEAVGSLQCLKVRIEAIEQVALAFGSPKWVELALRVPDVDAVENVQVEPQQARGKARVVGGAVQAEVGEDFELFFKLTGASDARVQVELHHPSGVENVTSCVPRARFPVSVVRALAVAPQPAAPARSKRGWLDELADPGARKVFEHLADHGTVTEEVATRLLGSARAARRFALHFDDYCKEVPFETGIDTVGGVKRYVRRGSE